MNKLILAALSILLLFSLAGCVHRVEQASTSEGASVELILYTWTEVTEQAANQELIAEFEREHPGIKVRLQNVPGSKEAMQKLQTMMAAGTPPDVMSLHGAYYYPFASKGTLADLEPFIQQDPDFDLADFYPGLVKVSRWEGTLFSLPRYTSVYTLIYNQALFDAAGLAYPDPQKPWTWDEYLAAARKLTRNPETPTGSWGVYIDFWGSRVFPWLWQNNADLMNEDRSQCVIDSPEAIEALDFVRALRWEHRVAPTSSTAERNEGLNMFMQGKVGLYMTGPWDVQTLLKQSGLRWDTAPLPMRKSTATLLGTENYAISAASQHPQEAWELYKFLLSPRSQEFMAEKLEKMPSRQSVAEGPYLQAPSKYNRRVFVDALDYARQAANIPEWDQVAHYLQDQLDIIWVGSKSTEEGLKAAARDMNGALKRIRAERD
ncbi:MAG: sugar ABC transporter substrate-binding protein [candidate division WS1 bacterium]|jgi:multiple sugar transport system substrate-binding protein|nr:sugar ABC transporter substrate-binding protein [candidate division WS1 bacterium]